MFIWINPFETLRALPMQKPAQFLCILITLLCNHFADVASDLLWEREKWRNDFYRRKLSPHTHQCMKKPSKLHWAEAARSYPLSLDPLLQRSRETTTHVLLLRSPEPARVKEAAPR